MLLRPSLRGPFVLLGMLLVVSNIATAQDSPQVDSEEFTVPAEEKPFWESAQSFVDAYASRDAEKIGELFTENAEFLDELGVRTHGRVAIVSRFKEAFVEGSQAMIEAINIEGVRHLSDTVAIEEGVVIATEGPGQPLNRNRYVAIHKKGEDGVWRIEILKDFPRKPLGREEQLAQLSWMLGEWVNEDSRAKVFTECGWSEDGNFLIREFVVRTFDGRELSGVQRTGWDPIHKKIRSWTFDSSGGFMSGIWTQLDGSWILTSAGFNSDGETVTSTAVYQIVDAETVKWHFENLVVGDEVHLSGNKITMVRQPPKPGLLEASEE
ncbi:YybH family protein [Thalassoglobus sp.]|uniref:YybH family protein n=1 Tax=Thalassoglobus sp. TaxID=2795869 RepID=UPI003AA834C2